MYVRALLYVVFVSGVVVTLPASPPSAEILHGREEFLILKTISEGLGEQSEADKKFFGDYLAAWERFRLLEDKSKFSTKADSPGEQAFFAEYVQAYVKSTEAWAEPEESSAGDIAKCFFCSMFTLGIASYWCC
jgi:hypothetical protein